MAKPKRTYNTTAMMLAGASIAGGNGVIGAIGPIVRGEKKVRETSSMVGDEYDTAIMGHWHQSIILDGLIVNSTLKGYDEFSRNIMRVKPELPNQTLLFVHPKYGIIDIRRVWLESKPTKKTNAWVSWKTAP